MTYLWLVFLSIAEANPDLVAEEKEATAREGRRSKAKKRIANANASGPLRFERTSIGPIDDFFTSAQGIENVLYNTSKNLNDAQQAMFIALDLAPDSNLSQVKDGIQNIGVKVQFTKGADGKKSFTIESELTPQKQAALQKAIIALFVLSKDLVKEVPDVIDDVRKLNRAINGIKDDFKAEIKVSVLTGEISPFKAIQAVGVLRRNIKKVPQMLISAVLLTRELKETINFFRFLFAGNDDLMGELKTPKKDPVQEAAKLNKDCVCDGIEQGPPPIRIEDSKSSSVQPAVKTTVVEEKKNTFLSISDHHQDKFYKGFGGVSIGIQQYKNFALNNGGTKLLDGRETLNNEHIRGTVVSSYYYSRLKESRVYLGYSISAMFSDSVFYSKNPRLLMNPYCSAYDSTVSSVNGGLAGGDQNMFRESEGSYEYEGSTYYYSCQEHFGVRVNRETLAHVPAEVNTAYVFRPTQKIMLWVAGGISVSWYDYKYVFTQSGYATHYDSYYQEEGQSVSDSMYDMYWNYSYEERFGASKTVEDEGWGALKNSYLLGTQASIGAEYIFGELPKIGGEWGLGILGKYSYIRGKKQNYEPYGGMDYEVTATNDKGYYWDVDEGSVVPLLSNWNLGGTLTWHY